MGRLSFKEIWSVMIMEIKETLLRRVKFLIVVNEIYKLTHGNILCAKNDSRRELELSKHLFRPCVMRYKLRVYIISMIINFCRFMTWNYI